MRRRVRKALVLICTVLPSPVKILIYRYLLGWRIGKDCRIGMSYIDAHNVDLGDNVSIGHFNVVRNLPRLQMGDKSIIGQWNWITCAETFSAANEHRKAEHEPGLSIGQHATISSRHYIDCAASVSIGEFTDIAGVRSTILTHQIDTTIAGQMAKPVWIGNYSFIGSDSRFTPGSAFPSRSVLGMGAVVAGELNEEWMLYGGVPARPLKRVEGKYFDRKEGWIGLANSTPDLDTAVAS